MDEVDGERAKDSAVEYREEEKVGLGRCRGHVFYFSDF